MIKMTIKVTIKMMKIKMVSAPLWMIDEVERSKQ